MKRFSLSVLLGVPLIILALMMALPNASANSTLFFDGFTTQGFPAQWTGFIASDQNNAGQIGNFLRLTVPRLANITSGDRVTSIVANQSLVPIVGPGTRDGQLIYMVWKMEPFNFTSQASAGPGLTMGQNRTIELDFGLRNPARFSQWNQILFKLLETETLKGIANTIPIKSKSQITVSIVHPMAAAANCFDNDIQGDSVTVNTCTQNTLSYETQGTTVDLNSLNIFTIYAKFYPVAHTSWIAFSVNSMGWLNVTQQACGCIDQAAAGGSYASIYPTIRLINGYDAVGPASVLVDTGQTWGAFINYVLVADYIPATLPTGQLLTCTLTGSCPIVPSNIGGIPKDSSNIPLYLQFAASNIGQGNLPLGGFILTLIMIVPLVGILIKLRVRSTFVYSMILFGVLGMNTLLGLVPLWAIIIVAIMALGSGVGLFRKIEPHGGEVQD